jgi:phosphohistidine phosphatase
MPRLILFRHAKAERAQPGSTDFDRALTKSGRTDSAEMGRALEKRGETIDLVLCSSAKRALETWDSAKPELGYEPETRLLRAIYEAEDYLPILNAEGGEAGTILLVGHNPTMQETAISLVADHSSKDSKALASRFPKAAFAVIDFDGSWAELRRGQGRLDAFILP